jgi:cytoskeletal protein RodZ
MTSIGEALRGERLRRGLKLEQIAAETKIRIQLLEAMEEDRFERLPPGYLTRSFLRQYTHKLGLNEDEVMTCFTERFETPVDPWPELEFKHSRWHIPFSPGLLWALAAIFACICVYRLTQNTQRSSPVKESHLRIRQPALPEREGAHLRSNTQLARQSAPPDVVLRPAVVADTKAISILQSSGHATGSVETLVGGAAKPMRVAFLATEPVWLSVKSDGTQAYSGTLSVKQSMEFGASSSMTVLIGNAGGLEVLLNGKPVRPIGTRGEVLRLILTPYAAYVIPRISPTLPPDG